MKNEVKYIQMQPAPKPTWWDNLKDDFIPCLIVAVFIGACIMIIVVGAVLMSYLTCGAQEIDADRAKKIVEPVDRSGLSIEPTRVILDPSCLWEISWVETTKRGEIYWDTGYCPAVPNTLVTSIELDTITHICWLRPVYEEEIEPRQAALDSTAAKIRQFWRITAEINQLRAKWRITDEEIEKLGEYNGP
jgi:hypothetical protein